MVKNWQRLGLGAKYIVYIMLNEMLDDWIRESEFTGCCRLIGDKYFYDEFLDIAQSAMRFLLEEGLATISEYNSPPWALSVDESIERVIDFLRLPESSDFRDEGFWLTITSKEREVVSELDKVFLNV